MKYWIGFDVGKNGGIAVIDEKNNIMVRSMPKVAKEIDVHAIRDFLISFEGDIHCGIEDVHSIFGTGAKSNFQFGRALGILEAMVVAFDFSFTKIAPKKWQSVMWEGISPVLINTGKKTKDGNIKYKTDTKQTSLLACKRLFPNIDLRDSDRKTDRSKKDHDGIVDALLIAAYVKRNF